MAWPDVLRKNIGRCHVLTSDRGRVGAQSRAKSGENMRAIKPVIVSVIALTSSIASAQTMQQRGYAEPAPAAPVVAPKAAAQPALPPPVAPAPQPTATSVAVQPEAPPPPPAPPPAPVAETGIDGAPKARRGFQMDLRMGPAIPWGRPTVQLQKTVGDIIGQEFSTQLTIGAKVSDSVFVGAYVGTQFGGGGDYLCGEGGCASRESITTRFGLTAQYHLTPSENRNWWLGVGFGTIKSVAQGRPYYNPESTITNIQHTISGVEFLNLSAGHDWRLGHWLGIGAFSDLSVVSYQDNEMIIEGMPNLVGAPSISLRPTSDMNYSMGGFFRVGIRGVLNP